MDATGQYGVGGAFLYMGTHELVDRTNLDGERAFAKKFGQLRTSERL